MCESQKRTENGTGMQGGEVATTHFHREVYKAGGPGLAAGRIAYITRGLSEAQVDARLAHQGRDAEGRDREDLIEWQARNLPAWARHDPVRYFSAAEQYERAGGVAYTEWRFSLPRELSAAHQRDAAQAMLESSFGTHHAYVYAIHNPPAADGGEQPHVHVLWSARTLDDLDRTPATFFRRYNAQHPERGGAQKAPWTNHQGAVRADRMRYA